MGAQADSGWLMFVATKTAAGLPISRVDADPPPIVAHVEIPETDRVDVDDPPVCRVSGWAVSTRSLPLHGIVKGGRTVREYFTCVEPRPDVLATLGDMFKSDDLAFGFAVDIRLPDDVDRLPVTIEITDGVHLAKSRRFDVRRVPPPVMVSGTPTDESIATLFTGQWWQPPLARGEDPDDAAWLQAGLAALGGVEGQRVLELGPGEGRHTGVLERAGAASIVAIEANEAAFARCLVTKELQALTRARFRLGDFVPYLSETAERFDLVVASGVLVHQREPLNLLSGIRRVAPRVLLRTRCFEGAAIERIPELRACFLDEPVERDVGSARVLLHPLRYGTQRDGSHFDGGPGPTGAWMTRDDLACVIGELGWQAREVLVPGLEDPTEIVLALSD